MKTLYISLFLLFASLLSFSQNINYNARISQFYAGNCGNDAGFNTLEEHTWKGWLSDDVSTLETYSGCVMRNYNGSVTQTGSYAYRLQTNTTATQLRARIDAWEDDSGLRCDFDPANFSNGDDCRVNLTSNINFTNPLEYQYTTANATVGSGDYNMNVFYQYRYSSATLADATEYGASSIITSGNRPFWGSRGAWGYSGQDCATSGTITHSQYSSFSTTVTCASQVSFRWRVSSEANFDFLRVYVNGVEKSSVSGDVNWTYITLPLDYGENTVEWRYTKDGSASVGLDRGFVDDISFTNAAAVDPGVVSGGETFNIIGNPSILTSVTDAQAYSVPTYQWQFSNDGMSGWIDVVGATTASYDPLDAVTTTRYYRRRVEDQCGNVSYSNVLQVLILPQYVYELGVWNPHDPGTTAFPSNSSHSVIIKETTTQTNSFTAGNLVVDPGVEFKLSGDVGVTVMSQVQLNGVLDLAEYGQLIQSDLSTLNVGLNGLLRVTRNGNPNLYRYTYWGSPVSTPSAVANSGFNISNVMNDGFTGVPRPLNFTGNNDGVAGNISTPAYVSSAWLYAYRNQPNNYSNWEQITSTTSLLSGQGYTMKGTNLGPGFQSFIFAGTPNNGDITLGITTDNNYLISNPYPSAIDAHQFLIDNPNLDGTLYFWEHYGGNTHQLSGYEGGYAMYNFSGGVGAPSIATADPNVSSNGTPVKIPGRYIPVAQGFFVKALTSGSIMFNNNQRIYIAESSGQSVFLRTSNTVTDEPIQSLDTRTKIRLGMTGVNQEHRQLLLTVDPATTYHVDRGYDGLSFTVLPNDFAFYLDDEYYNIQGIPSINANDEISLVINVSDSGVYRIGIDQLEYWDSNQDIYLYDNVLNVFYDLRLNEVAIHLETGQHIGRFSLRFTTNTLSALAYEFIEDDLRVYQLKNKKEIVIRLNSVKYKLEEVSLFDVNGKSVFNTIASRLKNESNQWFVDADALAPGAYVIKMRIGGSLHSKKIIIK